ncbi:FAD-dependent oxidoreductase [Reticulibacter mediterranei]|nr:NAD(P)/FAD-dependent oxidoreductase [Reticulibacter mediterranei]
MTTNTLPRIAIIGAGPGGLTLARLLQMHTIPTTVFEKENHPNERPQGGTLDLHTGSGLLAVHLAGLDAQFAPIARYEDQGMHVLSKEGQVLYTSEQENEVEVLGDHPEVDQAELRAMVRGERPEVDRAELRAMLLDSLAPGVVRWGHPLRSVRQAHDGSHELVFEHGQTEHFDLVVGADGAWSRVRPLLSNATPTYAGVTFIEFGLDDVDQLHPTLARLVGHGSMGVLPENNKRLVAQRNAHAHIRVYAAMRIPEKWETTNGFDASNPQKARAWLLNYFSDWDQSLLALIQESNDLFAVRPLYSLPIGHRWQFHAGATLLGDAAHLTPPSGEGVNLAMLDAVDLATAIGECSTLEEAVRRYEATMFARAAIAGRVAEEGMERFLPLVH